MTHPLAWVGKWALGVLLAPLSCTPAHAVDPAVRQSLSALLGVRATPAACADTTYLTRPTCEAAGKVWAGAKQATGLFEVAAVVGEGVLILATVAISFAGWWLVRRFVRAAGRGGRMSRDRGTSTARRRRLRRMRRARA